MPVSLGQPTSLAAMTPDEFAAKHHRLYHATSGGAWNRVFDDGLLSTSALLTEFGVEGDERTRIEEQIRPQSEELRHPTRGTAAVIRDQRPLISEARLEASLDEGMTTSRFLRLINERVYFWIDLQRLKTMLSAYGDGRVVKGRRG
jgi:hypothetical protein